MVYPGACLLAVDTEASENKGYVDAGDIIEIVDESLPEGGTWILNDNCLEVGRMDEVELEDIADTLKELLNLLDYHGAKWHEGKVPVQTETKGSGILQLRGNSLLLTLTDNDGKPYQNVYPIRVTRVP
jgi:hypothetical protein